jgi:hypothetical protein
MKKIVITLVVVAILFCVYSAMMAGYTYVTISNVMDEVVPRQIGTQGVADAYGAQERNQRVQKAVVQSVTDAGVPIEATAVEVGEDGGRLAVRVSYPYPVIRLQGETKAAIPVSVTSTFPLPPKRE